MKLNESLRDAGRVEIESTCWSLGSRLKGFVLFWLGGSIDTSSVNTSRVRWGRSEHAPDSCNTVTVAFVFNRRVLDLTDFIQL